MLVIVVLSSITVFLLCLLVYQYAGRDKLAVQDRVAAYAAPAVTKAPVSSGKGAEQDRWRRVLRFFARFFVQAPKAELLDHKMVQAGLTMRGSEFLVLSLGTAVVVGLAVYVATRGQALWAVLAAVVTYVLILAYLDLKIAKRLRAFNNQLVDAIAMMANALRAGFSFLQTMEMISREMPAPISEEFARTVKETQFGVTTEDALDNLVRRVNSADLELVVTAVLIQRQLGGNLAVILDNIAQTIRDRVLVKQEMRTLTAQGRISGWIVGLLPIFLLLAILVINRSYILTLFTDPLGHILVTGAVISQVFGILVIRSMVRIDL